jgi:hypothetical protein
MMSAVQFTSCTAFLPIFVFIGEINNGGEHRPDDHPEQLVPVEERNADPGRLNLVVEGRPEDRDELDHEQEIPWAPSRAPCAALIHVSPRKRFAFADKITRAWPPIKAKDGPCQVN